MSFSETVISIYGVLPNDVLVYHHHHCHSHRRLHDFLKFDLGNVVRVQIEPIPGINRLVDELSETTV